MVAVAAADVPGCGEWDLDLCSREAIAENSVGASLSR